jgi:bifunctional enzyme CysN/CysC
MADAGLIVIVSLISPFAAERQIARETAKPIRFFEIFVDTPIETCIRRDPKGLYNKALRGEIQNFTGVSSPYERPTAPDYTIAGHGLEPEGLASHLLRQIGLRLREDDDPR